MRSRTRGVDSPRRFEGLDVLVAPGAPMSAVATTNAPLRAAGGHMAPLDGLRGLAILMVMAFHFAWVQPPRSLPAKLFVFVGSFGWAGVDLFFVLSGFLITGILLDSKSEPYYFRNFYARRILRIFPLYYSVLLVTLVVLPHFVSYDTPELTALLRSQAWLWLYSANVSVAVEHGHWLWNADWLRLGMLWSLAVEEHFYLVWPLLVFVLVATGHASHINRHRRGAPLPSRRDVARRRRARTPSTVCRSSASTRCQSGGSWRWSSATERSSLACEREPPSSEALVWSSCWG